MQNTKPVLSKYIAILSAIAILSVVIFSMFYVAHERHHDCSGKDCPICAAIMECEHILHQTMQAIRYSAVIVVFVLTCVMSVCSPLCNIKKTLISQKIRLND